MSSLIIKPARVRAYMLMMVLMASVGGLVAVGLQMVLEEPEGFLLTATVVDPDSWKSLLADVQRWWVGTVCLVFAAFAFLAIPRLMFVFIDNQIAVIDERGITVRSFKLKTRRVLWKELNSLNASMFGVRLDSTRGALSLPLVFGRTSVDEVIYLISYFRPDLIPGQSRRFA